jgi:hypothetical protein
MVRLFYYWIPKLKNEFSARRIGPVIDITDDLILPPKTYKTSINHGFNDS